MDLISEPTFTEETVTDIDIGFSNGFVKPLTLRADDILQKHENGGITIRYASGEILGLPARHIAWTSERTRIIRRPIRGTPTAKDSSPPAASPAPQPAAVPSAPFQQNPLDTP